MALLHVNFFSDVLGMRTEMDVILPQATRGQIGVAETGAAGKCQALYLLHGMSDDHTIWQRRTSIERYVAEYNLAVVMPTTHLGWYADMHMGYDYFRFIARELPEVVRGMFPGVSAARCDTFAAGLSMGGYGALRCGLLASDVFSHVACLSGALDVADTCESIPPDDENARLFRDIFGPPEGVRGSRDDLLSVAERLATENRPKVFIWCGTEDFLYQQSRTMKARLEKLGYDLSYSEGPGDHSWPHWDREIQNVLKWLPLQGGESPWR